MKLSPYAKDLLSRKLMTLSEALKIVSPSWANANMIKCLQLAPWHNSESDEKRLVAAIIVERNRSKIYYGGPKKGYQTSFRE